MKPYSPTTAKGRTVAGDDIHRHTADQPRAAAKAAAKAMRHAARQQGSRQAAGPGAQRYDTAAIARELEATAAGAGHYGNALRVAKDLPGVDSEERALLDRWATGRQRDPDDVALRVLAGKLRQLPS